LGVVVLVQVAAMGIVVSVAAEMMSEENTD
jgi:hypothetical protein